MSETARLERDGDARYRVVGPMTVATVPALWPELARALGNGGELDLSLAGVTRADSTAVACLVACMRTAVGQVRFTDMPESMRVIVEVSDLEALFAPSTNAA